MKLILVRHGQSLWNAKNLFTGWEDVGLSERGEKEARIAGQQIKKKGFFPQRAYTSYLKRASDTLEIILETLGKDAPIKRSWKLNERHYGALQGKNKKECRKEFGENQVFQWRRSFEDSPPPINDEENESLRLKLGYKDVSKEEFPKGESLKETQERVMSYFEKEILPHKNERILIVAHGNSLRGLIKHLEKIPDEEISLLDVPTGTPIFYELDEDLKVKKKEIFYSEDKMEELLKNS